MGSNFCYNLNIGIVELIWVFTADIKNSLLENCATVFKTILKLSNVVETMTNHILQ